MQSEIQTIPKEKTTQSQVAIYRIESYVPYFAVLPVNADCSTDTKNVVPAYRDYGVIGNYFPSLVCNSFLVEISRIVAIASDENCKSPESVWKYDEDNLFLLKE